MYNIYSNNENGILYKNNQIGYGCWIHMVAPSVHEMTHVAHTLGIPIDFIKAPLDGEERARIEKVNNHTLIIIDMPTITKNEKDQLIYATVPLGIILTGDCIVMVCSTEHSIMNQFIHTKAKHFYTNKKTNFSLQVLYVITLLYLRYLKQISKMMNEIENELLQSKKNKELVSLLHVEKSLIYFTTSLKSNHMVMQKMLRHPFLKMGEEDRQLLEDVLLENQQAIELAATYSTILSSMMNAFASVTSNNLNVVIKFLTSVTIILSLPMIVASFYGMNVPIPFQSGPHAFLVAILISILLSGTTALIFWKKRFF